MKGSDSDMGKTVLQISEQKGVDIHPGMFGLFFEDINYACDGGINAEQIENPSFSFREALGGKSCYSTKFDGLYGWVAWPTGADGAELSVTCDRPVHPNNPWHLHFKASPEQLGVANKAFDGITLRAGASYTVGAWLRSDVYRGRVTAAVYDGDTPVVQATLAPAVTGEWVRYETSVVSPADRRHGRFVLSVDEAAAIDVDFVSCKPQDAVCGVFRRDLAECLKAMKPGFVRFPGGCVVEGNKLSNRYRWKYTVGPLEERIPNWNRWAVHGNPEKDFFIGSFSHYNQTCAIGYYEYFLLCEYLGAKPLPVQNVGLACQYQSSQLVEPEDPAFAEYVQDVLDLIEFANGPATGKWGALRAQMGHPAPFGLEMIGIGNEQWETGHSHFSERYERFEKAIHARYPDIRLIGSAGPDVTSARYTDAWGFYRERTRRNPGFVYAVDEHYYRPLEWMRGNDHFYDCYPRDVKVFAGEYAAHIPDGSRTPAMNTLGAALAEAAFLTGVERNADVVVMASYAPLFARLGYAQWAPDLIWFDDRLSFGTPSYFVQQLYSANLGRYTLASAVAGGPDGFYASVSYDPAAHEIIVKLVNTADAPAPVTLAIAPALQAADEADAVLLTGAADACNTADEPEKITPVRRRIPLGGTAYAAPAASFTVLRIQAGLGADSAGPR